MGVKISQLPVHTNAAVHTGDSMPIVDSAAGELKQITMGQLDIRYQGVPDGGTSQQVLAKNSATNKDVYWKTLDKNSVGLGQVDNTSDTNKPISSATQAALNLKANTSALSTKADVTALTTGLATKQDKLPSGSNGEVLTLVAGIPAWVAGGGGGGAVSSVFGRIGAVVAQTGDYDKSMIGLDQVDNTSDLDKPISNLTQTALSGKQASLPAGSNGQVLSLSGGVPAWVATPVVSPLTTKGDLYVFGSANTRLPVGTDGQVILADSTQASGMKWAPAPSGIPAITPTTDQGKALIINGSDQAAWTTIPAAYVKAFFGTTAGPRAIVAAVGITSGASHMSTTADTQTIIAKGPSAGMTTITANPQIEGSAVLGSVMTIVGYSDTDGFELNTGNGLILTGPWQSGLGNSLTLKAITASLYVETGRTSL